MYEKLGLFRVTCDYTIKANNRKQAENHVKKGAGINFYESHLVIKPIEICVDINLTDK